MIYVYLYSFLYIMSSFQDYGVCVHNNPEAEAKNSYAHAALNYKTEREPVLRGMRETPLGFCLRVIVNEKPS